MTQSSNASDFNPGEAITSQEKYLLVNVVSKRIRELFRGSKPLVERLSDSEPIEDIAVREFRAGVLTIYPKKPDEQLVEVAKDDE